MDISNIILLVFMHSLAFGVACYYMGAQREIGAMAGGFLGFLLGMIGFIIVLVSHKKGPQQFFDQLQNYEAMLDSGMITETEYKNLKGQLFEKF